MTAYYNEINKYAAQHLRNLIEAGHIAPGVVDERSIVDVKPDELLGYTQCHFFAGIGVWSYALRQAGWPDDKPVWTGSCPCQPFSTAGKGNGFDDERHLWPHLQWLIQQCRPAEILGEQVASKDADAWIDLVHADMEAMGYAFGCVPFPSASVGAPHIRDRTYWVANAQELPQRSLNGESGKSIRQQVETGGHGVFGRMANANSAGLGADAIGEFHHAKHNAESCGGVIGLANSASIRCGCGSESATIQEGWQPRSDAGRELAAGLEGCALPNSISTALRIDRPELLPGPVNGLWRSADWLHCRDGKWRPVEPGTFPLVNGSAGRVGRVRTDQERIAEVAERKDQGSRTGRLKGYGNAINAYQAQIFIEAYLGN